MTEDFNNFSKKIALSIKKQNLNAGFVENFILYTEQIIYQGILSNPNSDKTDQYLNDTIPKIASSLLSSYQMNQTQLQFSIQIIDVLNNLALWAMLNNKDKLINDLLVMTNSNAPYYIKNHQMPTLFADRVHFFNKSPFFTKLNEKLDNINEFTTPALFSIFAFLLRYCSSLDSDDETGQIFAYMFPMKFNDFAATLDDQTFSQCQASNLVIIMNSLYTIYESFDLLDALPIFVELLLRSAKCEDLDKKLTALRILNTYALSSDPQISENFDQPIAGSDIVTTIINNDLRLEVLQTSRELIRKIIQDEELYEFLTKGEECFVANRYFIFRLVAQIMVERLDRDSIIEIIKALQNPVDIEFLIFLMMDILQNNDEEKLPACEEIVGIIFELGEGNLEEIKPRMVLFFKELNIIDQNRNNPTITRWRVSVLNEYTQILTADEFDDRTCIFLTNQFEELRRVTLLQPSTAPFPEIQNILNDTLDKVQQHYLNTGIVSEAIIRLFYILVLFRNIKFILGKPNHIQVREPSRYEFFDFALAALSYTNDPSVADVAIELFSQFFSQTSFFSESISILYQFCKDYFSDEVDEMAKYRVLKLIYKVLLDLESDYELIDFENRRRNHRNDTKGKMIFKVGYGETEFDIYAKPNSQTFQLINRIAMRLFGTAEMINVTDYNKRQLNPGQIVSTLEQPLSVICKNNYKQVKYISASYTLWNQSFTTTLLHILDTSSNPELTNITKRLLSFLPCDHKIMHAKVDDYLQMINDSQSDVKFKYLLHCINHFTPNIKKEIGGKIEKIWAKIKSQKTCLSAIFEFFLCILNEENRGDYPMFLGGRVFRALYLHDKKAYQIATDLYTKTLTKYINVNDNNFIRKILVNCNDEEWPYLEQIFKTFQSKEAIFIDCIAEVKENKLKHKFVIKLLAMYVKDVMSTSENIDPLLNTIEQLDDCDPDELIDVMKVITDLDISQPREHFTKNPDELNKLITLAFKKGSLEAEKLILNFYRKFESNISQPTSSILRQFFDKNFELDVWKYKSSEHIQNKLGIGLVNPQATSYMNSLFQVFNRMPEFLNLIFESSDPKLQNLQWVLASLQKSNRDYIDPRKFIEDCPFNPKVEHDVFEFYQYIMNDCPEEAKDLFRGEQLINYTGDEFEKEVTESFFSIPIKVKGFTNLTQSMNTLLEPEIISDFDDGNGNKIIVSKEMKITKVPKILVVQLRRFEYDQERQRNVKINQRFEFPEHLNIISLLAEEKNTFYSLHSIICSDNQGDGYYALLHKEKNYNKVADIFSSDEEEWIRIKDRTINELNSSYKEEAYGGRSASQNDPQLGNAYLLFYVLDEFIVQNEAKLAEDKPAENEPVDTKQVEIKIGEDLLNTILKENEVFGTMQTLFSVDVASFLQQSPSKDANIYYLYNILMHGTEEFVEYANDITKSIDIQTAIGYTDQNFSKFQAIFEKDIPERLLNPFIEFARTMMEKKDAIQILRRILDVLSIDQIPERAISPFLMLVYSYLKVNGPPEEPFDIINKLVTFIISCIKQSLTSIKIDDAFLSLAKLLEWGKNNNINRLHNSCDLKPIEENYNFIPGHLSDIKSLHDFVEQAVKYDLMDIKFFFELKDINDQKLANVLSEKNYISIGKIYPDKVNDILSIAIANWDEDRKRNFANSLYPDGIMDKEKQAFTIYFLTNNFYKDPEPIISLISNAPLNIEILEKIIIINLIQTQKTYQYILDNIQKSENENDVLSLIKMNQYLFGFYKANDLFEKIFSNAPNNKEIIIKRFEAFLKATEYSKSEYPSIKDLEIYKKFEDIFKSSSLFKNFDDSAA